MSLEKPRFRRDLIAKSFEVDGQGYVEVRDPRTGGNFCFYDFEYRVALAFDGLLLEKVIPWVKLSTGMELDISQLKEFAVHLEQMGYLEPEEGLTPALETITTPELIVPILATDPPSGTSEPAPPPLPPLAALAPSPVPVPEAVTESVTVEEPVTESVTVTEAVAVTESVAVPEAVTEPLPKPIPTPVPEPVIEAVPTPEEIEEARMAAEPEPTPEVDIFSVKMLTEMQAGKAGQEPQVPWEPESTKEAEGDQLREAPPMPEQVSLDGIAIVTDADEPSPTTAETKSDRNDTKPIEAVQTDAAGQPPVEAKEEVGPALVEAKEKAGTGAAGEQEVVLSAVSGQTDSPAFPVLPISPVKPVEPVPPPTAEPVPSVTQPTWMTPRPHLTPGPGSIGPSLLAEHPSARRRTRRSLMVFGSLGVLAAIGVLAIMLPFLLRPHEPPMLEVRTLVAIPSTIHAIPGVVLKFPAAGKVTRIAGVGSMVAVGDVAASIDLARPLQNQLAYLRERLAFHQQMAEAMHQVGNTKEEERQVANVEVRNAKIAKTLHDLSNLAVVANAAGEVEETFAREGDQVRVDSQALRLRSAGFRSRFELPRGQAALASRLAFCQVEVDGYAFDCTQVQEGSDDNHVTVDVVTIPPALVGRPARLARARYDNALVVPLSAVLRTGNRDEIQVVSPQARVELRLVTVAERDATLAIVIQGLDAGENIVVGAPSGLRAGMKVRILP
jgi:hypothetical protein